MALNRFARASFAAALFAMLAPHTYADSPAPNATPIPKPAKPLVYLSAGAVDFLTLLPPPPTPDSLEQQSELHEIKAWQSLRTSEMEARCKDEEKLSVFRAFATIMGPNFTAEKLPLTAKLMADIEGDSKHFSSAAKNHWTRARPPFIDSSLKPAATLEDEPSYPSGHATRGMMFAVILSKMAPSKTDALFRRGEEIGYDRVIAAVHYPSDVVAGRVLGQAVADALLANPKFQHDLAAATAELHNAVAVASR